MTYNYDTGSISKFALKRVNNSCHKDESRTRMIGVMCKSCPFYDGTADRHIDWESLQLGSLPPYERFNYVVCTAFDKDDEGPDVQKVRHAIYETLEHHALCALCD